MRLKNLLLIFLAVALILLALWSAMQVTGSGAWSAFDFALAGALLLGAGLAYAWVASRSGSGAYRAGAGLAVAAALLLTWGSLALGVIGSEDHPANLMYAGVLAVLIAGALVARFRAGGLARALALTALTQALVTALALAAVPGVETLEVLGLNAFFIALWLGSAWLFRRA